jgi:GMP synthase (glutamine-hydrolysing)
VRANFAAISARSFQVAYAKTESLTALASVTDPEQKRHIIGEKFVDVQQRILESEHFLDANWILGQGTIYPDTIESGGTAKADLIKTHHNRVAGIQRLIEEGRIIEPLSSFTRTVRAIGRQIGLAPNSDGILPRPWSRDSLPLFRYRRSRGPPTGMYPVRSVGVPGDSRTSIGSGDQRFPPPARCGAPDQQTRPVNRVWWAGLQPIGEMRVKPATLTEISLNLLRRAGLNRAKPDQESGFDASIWQNPVI